MPPDLPDRIRDAGAQPTRPFDLDRSLRRRRRRRAAEGLTYSGLTVAVVIAATVNLPLGGRTPERPLVAGDDRPPACTDAARLPDLAGAADVGDDVVLFAACATAPNYTEMLTGPNVALARGTPREEATASQLAELYLEGLTSGELDAGYSLAATDLPAGALTATRDADVVTVNVTAEVLERPNATTTYLADAFLEQVGALFLQLPGVDRVAFELEGSCQDFATTLERVPCLIVTPAGIELTEVADDPDLRTLTDLERSLIRTLGNLNVQAVRAELPGPKSSSNSTSTGSIRPRSPTSNHISTLGW